MQLDPNWPEHPMTAISAMLLEVEMFSVLEISTIARLPSMIDVEVPANTPAGMNVQSVTSILDRLQYVSYCALTNLGAVASDSITAPLQVLAD
jgi:hypothetical protein